MGSGWRAGFISLPDFSSYQQNCKPKRLGFIFAMGPLGATSCLFTRIRQACPSLSWVPVPQLNTSPLALLWLIFVLADLIDFTFSNCRCDHSAEARLRYLKIVIQTPDSHFSVSAYSSCTVGRAYTDPNPW